MAHVVNFKNSTTDNLAAHTEVAPHSVYTSCACICCRTARVAAKTASPGSSVATRSRADFMDNHCGSMAFSSGQNNMRSASDFRCCTVHVSCLIQSMYTFSNAQIRCLHISHSLQCCQGRFACLLSTYSTALVSTLADSALASLLARASNTCSRCKSTTAQAKRDSMHRSSVQLVL